MKTIQRRIVAALLVSKDNKLFLAFKSTARKHVYADCWHIPGGGIEEGESASQAIIREVKEEIGLDVSDATMEQIPFSYIGESTKESKTGEMMKVHMSFIPFKISLLRSAQDIMITLNEEFSKYKWVALDQLDIVKHTPPSKVLLQQIGWLK